MQCNRKSLTVVLTNNYRVGPTRISFKSCPLTLYEEYLNVVICEISVCFIPENNEILIEGNTECFSTWSHTQ